MFSKIFGSRGAPKVTTSVPDRPLSPLRIIHAGGYVEYYYMAIPAVSIIEKYPRAVLARPDVFHQPWEAVVHPEEILTPGEKFYIVPRRTVLKLQKRTRQPRAPQPQPQPQPQPDTVIVSEGESKSDDCGASDKVITKKNVKLSSRRTGFAGMWQPSLVAIDERSPLKAPLPPSPIEGFI